MVACHEMVGTHFHQTRIAVFAVLCALVAALAEPALIGEVHRGGDLAPDQGALGPLLAHHRDGDGGLVDQIIMRCVDVFYSIPNIMIAVVVVSLLGTSTVNLLIALSFTCATSFCRIARAAVMTIRDQEYIESAYAMGLPTWKIILKHIIPNCLSPIIVQVTLLIGTTSPP